MRLAIAPLLSGAISAGLGAQQIGRAEARADLDTLRNVVRRYSAYRLVNRYPFERHLDSLKAGMPETISLGAFFWHAVQTLIGRLQDAHSNVPMPAAVRSAAPSGELPFALTSVGDTVIAVMPCGCGLLAPEHPRLVAIKGIAIDSLMRVAGVRFRGLSAAVSVPRAGRSDADRGRSHASGGAEPPYARRSPHSSLRGTTRLTVSSRSALAPFGARRRRHGT